MSSLNTGQTRTPALSGLAWLPLAWLVFSMAMSIYHAWVAWPALNDYDLPAAAVWLIQAELIVSAIALVGGLFVLVAALGRMPIYPTAFTLWQGFVILALIAVAIYTAIFPYFVLAPLSYVYWLGEILIGIACIIIVRKPPTEPHPMAQAQSDEFSTAARIVLTILGVLVGGFIGFWLGLGIGVAIVEIADISCFEGACGYFAFFVALAGVPVGAIIGVVLALYWTRRKKPAVTP